MLRRVRGEGLGIPSPILGAMTSLCSCSTSSSSPCRLTVVLPHLQFIDRVLDIPVLPQRQIPTVQTVQQPSDSTVQFLVWFLTRPLLRHVRCRGVMAVLVVHCQWHVQGWSAG